MENDNQNQNPENKEDQKPGEQPAATGDTAAEGAAGANASEQNNDPNQKPEGDTSSDGAGEEGSQQGDGDGSQGSDEDPALTWSKQSRKAQPAAGDNPDGGNGGSDDADLRKQIETQRVRIEALETELAKYKHLDALQADPVIAAYSSFRKLHGNEKDPSEFLTELGVLHSRDDDDNDSMELIEKYYRQKGESLGFKGDRLESSVLQKVNEFNSKADLDQAEELLEIKKKLGLKKDVKSIDEWKKELDSTYSKELMEQARYAKRQLILLDDYLTHCVEKKLKVNGIVMTEKRREEAIQFAKDSPMMLDPTFVVLSDPAEDGVQDYYMPDVVKKIVAVKYTDEIMDNFNKSVASARTQNLTERAKEAEQQRIAKEKQEFVNKTKDSYQSALEEMRRKEGRTP